MTRIRSPNYPALSLPAAIERARAIHKSEGRSAVSRDAVVKHLGFSSLNGASATVLSALTKYGLIEGVSDGEVRITDLGMRVMFPHTEDEKRTAISEAAFRAPLFAEIRDKWPDRIPTQESLRPFLIRKGFTESALNQVIQVYRETLDMVSPPGETQNAPVETTSQGEQMPESTTTSAVPPQPAPAPLVGGRPFNVTFDGDVLTGTLALRTVRDLERLIKVLNAQKAAMEAMQDDPDDDEVLTDHPALNEGRSSH